MSAHLALRLSGVKLLSLPSSTKWLKLRAAQLGADKVAKDAPLAIAPHLTVAPTEDVPTGEEALEEVPTLAARSRIAPTLVGAQALLTARKAAERQEETAKVALNIVRKADSKITMPTKADRPTAAVATPISLALGKAALARTDLVTENHVREQALVITADRGKEDRDNEVTDSVLKVRDLSTAAVVLLTALSDPPGALQDSGW